MDKKIKFLVIATNENCFTDCQTKTVILIDLKIIIDV